MTARAMLPRMVMELPSNPSQPQNHEEGARAATAKINVSLPAAVVSYDRTKQTVTIRLIPSRKRRDAAAGGAVVSYRPGNIANVPVAFPSADGHAITWPLAVGAKGVAVFFDRSVDEYKSTGASSTEPQDPRRFDLTDAWFVPAVRSPATPLPAGAVDADAMVVWADDGKVVKLGDSSAASMVALSDLVDLRFTQLAAVFTAWAPVPLDGGLALKTALTALMSGPTPWPQSVAATKVKAT